ncbi:outer envelope pore protein 16, chloroplastic-like [Rosa sericea]
MTSPMLSSRAQLLDLPKLLQRILTMPSKGERFKSGHDFEYTLKSMCNEGAYYGGFLVLPIEILPHIQEKAEDINANLKVLSR